MYDLYNNVSLDCSKLITRRYSTSFSMGIRLFEKKYRGPIYAIYGFVRLADEIVDTFHDQDKAGLLQRFREETFEAIDLGFSLNPVLQAFQKVVRAYNIDKPLVESFLDSMEMDLHHSVYDYALYKKYIYGSAEVVGLMCLKIFTKGKEEQYEELRDYACALGSAFQKINFLRDIKSDFDERGRVYFPEVDYNAFNEKQKMEIESDIQADFDQGLAGIKQLPKGAKLGVYLAYIYYIQLFKKINATTASHVKSERIRVRNRRKLYLLATSTVKNRLGLI